MPDVEELMGIWEVSERVREALDLAIVLTIRCNVTCLAYHGNER